MRSISKVNTIGVLLAAIAASTGAKAENGPAKTPVVVELFTSQSCNSCVAAANYFRELAKRDDVVALGWHVDYWNMLNTKHGSWTDPYSNAAYTERQRRYNKTIRHRSSIYTPQMVVAGAGEAVGSSQEKIGALIDEAQTRRGLAPVFTEETADGVVFHVGESPRGGNAYLMTMKKNVETKILRGENAGMSFWDVNVVTNVRPLGVVRRSGAQITAPAPAEGETCALIVQEPRQGRIIGAAYCK